MESNDRRTRILVAGAIGALSALVVAISDILLLGIDASGSEAAEKEIRELVADKGGVELLLGAFGAYGIFLLIVGYWHWYTAAKPEARRGMIVALGFLAAGLVSGGLFHFALGPIGLAMNESAGEIDPAVSDEIYDALAYQYIVPLYAVAMGCIAIASVIFIYQVVRGRTYFPRWFALSAPLCIWPLSSVITYLLPAPIGGFAISSFHWPTIVAFLLSTHLLLARRPVGDTVDTAPGPDGSVPERLPEPQMR
ncbi:MAG: DUF6796 family protein [Actinomycetota bacterium]